jgi:protein SCO1
LLVVGGSVIFAPPYQFQGSFIDPPARAHDFELVDGRNQLWRLSDQEGKIVVMFFGYTSCPDVCPLTLSKFKQMKTLLKNDADWVTFVYITVDPQRDIPEKMQAHLQAFDETFIGLTGSEEQLQPVWTNYGVFRARVDVESAAGYLMDHSATTYVINSRGDLRLTFPYGMDAAQMARDIAQIIKE